MTTVTFEQLLGDIPAAPVSRPRARGLRAVIADAKPWQAVLVDWASGVPMTMGDPSSRHWTRWGARRAADWANLRVLPTGICGGLLRYAALPTRHPSVT